MAVSFENLILDTFDMVSAFDISTGDLLFMLDQIKDGSLENTSDSVEMTGKQGALLSVLERNKAATFSCNNAYFVSGALAAQTGSDVVDATDGEPLVVPDFVRLKMTTATTCVLPNTPVGAEGAEVAAVWKVNSDGSQGQKFEVIADTPETGKFTCEADTKTLTFFEGDLTASDEIYVDYKYEVTEGRLISNVSDNFGKTVRLLCDVLFRDKCDNSKLYHGKLEMPVAKCEGNFTLEVGDEPGVHAFSARTLANVCSTDNTLWNMYLCE